MSAFVRAVSSTKFLIFVILIIAATALVWVGKIDVKDWLEFAKWVGGAWIVGQGLADFGKHKGKVEAPPKE